MFVKSYKKIYNPESYFLYLKDVERNINFYKNSTYSESYNKKLLREANNYSLLACKMQINIKHFYLKNF